MKHNSITISVFLASLVSVICSADSILIKNADIYNALGMSAQTHLYLDNGIISGLGDSAPTSADMIIEGRGMSVTAGLFNAATHIGTVEIEQIEQTVDFYSDNQAVTASLKLADAFNPRSTLIPHNRTHGLSHAILMPELSFNTMGSGSGSLFAGQVALVQLGNQPRVVNDSVAVAVDYSEAGISQVGNSRAAGLAHLRQALTDAQHFAANKAAAMAGNHRDYMLSHADLEALGPVVKGTKPLLVKTHRASDISNILQLAADYNLTLILSGATEAWMVADQIASAGVSVIIDPINNLPISYESLGARIDNAQLLAEAGVNMLFTGMDWHSTHNAYLVRQSAGNAVANGLDKFAAIAAMTRNPAKLFGAEVSGTIKLGEVADLVLWDGDPLEMTSEAKLVIINGEVIPMQSRSLQLRDRYYKRLQALQQ